MMAQAASVVAVDVGGTLMKGAVVDATGRAQHRRRVETPRTEGPDAVLRQLLVLLDELVATAEGSVAGIGVAVPGLIDERDGVAVRAANLGWHALPVADRVAEHTGRPAVLGHDVRCGALAEARLGAATGAGSPLFVPIGTGIGGALIVDGRVLLGAHTAAVEIGHLVVAPDGPRCGCGRHGCLEAVASADAIARSYARRAGTPVSEAGAELVVRRLGDGDVDAEAVWDVATTAIADALGTCLTVLDPDVIVLGGGLVNAGDALLAPVRARLARYRSFEAEVPVLAATLGDEAGCIGAALLALDRHARGDPS